jgi:hypothetical protein
MQRASAISRFVLRRAKSCATPAWRGVRPKQSGGLYFARLQAKGQVLMRKITVVR